MKRFVALASLGLLLTGGLPSSVAACSWGYKSGYSPEEIKRRTDVTAVRANFRFEEMRGEPGVNEEGEEVLLNAVVVGRIEIGITLLETIHYPARELGTCQFPGTGPAADARGTFWITDRAEDGRHRILYWEGEYLQPEQTQADSTE